MGRSKKLRGDRVPHLGDIGGRKWNCPTQPPQMGRSKKVRGNKVPHLGDLGGRTFLGDLGGKRFLDIQEAI